MKNTGRLSSFVGFFVVAGLCASLYQFFTNHWPNLLMLLIYAFGWGTSDAYLRIVKLMERQNVLLEQVFNILKADRHDYEEPLGRR